MSNRQTEKIHWRPSKKWTVLALCLLAALFTLPIAIPEVGDYLSTKLNSHRLGALYQPAADGEPPAAPPPPLDSGEEAPAAPPAVLPELAQAYEANGQLAGWINIADGGLTMPVVQGDDNEYYLKHDFYGRENTNGTIYLDYRNQIFPPDYNTIVYGHNVGGNMFHILENYKKLEYLQAHPTFTFDTLYERGEYVIFSVFLASTREEQGAVFDYINQLEPRTDQQKEQYLRQLREHSLANAEVDVTADDRIVTLSTCIYEFKDARIALVARRLRPGETAQSFPATAFTANGEAVMPEIWTQLFG